MRSHAIPFRITCHLLCRHALRWVALGLLLLSPVAPALADASPNFAYVSVQASHKVEIYEVEAVSGLLKFRGTAAHGSCRGPVTSMSHPNLSVLYVLCADSFTIAVFQMDRASGALQLMSTVNAGPGNIAGVIADQFLYVSYNRPPLSGPPLQGPSNGLLKYAIAQNGDLTLKELIGSGGTAPSAVAHDPKQPFFSVTNQYSNNLARLRMDPAGQLTLIQVATTGIYPVAVEPHPIDPFLYVANLSSKNLSIFSINADGKVTLTGIAAADYGPSSLAFAHDGRHLYVTNSISNTLATYSVLNGRLTRIGTTATGSDPKHVTVGPNGDYLYISNLISGTVDVCKIVNGLPIRIGTVKTGYFTRSVAIVTPH